MRRISAIVSLLILTGLTGCGGSDALKRTDVSGTVTYNGTPIADGDIVFLPDSSTKAPPGSGTIKDGAYKLTDRSGLVAGTYTVQIRAYKEFASNELSPGGLDRPQSVGMPAKEQTLPEKFNTKSMIDPVTISGDAPVTRNFELKD